MSAGDVIGSVDLGGCSPTVFEQEAGGRTLIVHVPGLSVRLDLDAEQAAALARLLAEAKP